MFSVFKNATRLVPTWPNAPGTSAVNAACNVAIVGDAEVSTSRALAAADCAFARSDGDSCSGMMAQNPPMAFAVVVTVVTCAGVGAVLADWKAAQDASRTSAEKPIGTVRGYGACFSAYFNMAFSFVWLGWSDAVERGDELIRQSV